MENPHHRQFYPIWIGSQRKNVFLLSFIIHFKFHALTDSAIRHQMLLLQSKHSHGILRRGAEVTKDTDNISGCYCTISILCDRFLVSYIMHSVRRANFNVP